MKPDALLWFDDSGLDLVAKVSRAAAHYRRKFGRAADTCYAPPGEVPNGEMMIGGIRVIAQRGTLTNHYLIGVEKMDKTQEELTVSEIMDMEPQQFELFTDDLREKEQDYRDEQAQARRPM